MSDDKAKAGKSSSKGGQKPRRKTNRPTPFKGPETSSWLVPGRVIEDFFRDPRYSEKTVKLTMSKDIKNVSVKFKFKTQDDLGLKMDTKEFDGPGYLAFKAERKERHMALQMEQSWIAFRDKCQSRLGKAPKKPEIFESKARAIALSFLTPAERAVMQLSQKEWDNADKSKVKDFLAKYGGSTLAKRVDALSEAFSSGKLPEKVQFDETETTTFKKKTVADLVARGPEGSGAAASNATNSANS